MSGHSLKAKKSFKTLVLWLKNFKSDYFLTHFFVKQIHPKNTAKKDFI